MSAANIIKRAKKDPETRGKFMDVPSVEKRLRRAMRANVLASAILEQGDQDDPDVLIDREEANALVDALREAHTDLYWLTQRLEPQILNRLAPTDDQRHEMEGAS